MLGASPLSQYPISDAPLGSTPVLPKLSTLTDDFTSTTRDAAKWTQSGTATVPAQAGGTLNFTTSTTAGYATYTSFIQAYDLTSDAVSVQITATGNQSLASLEAYPVQVFKTADPNTVVWWYFTGGFIRPYKKVAGVQTALSTVDTLNLGTHRYLRIRESAGTTYWEYSGNGTTWTVKYSEANSFAMTSVSAEIAVGTYAAEASSTVVSFDNFGLMPTAGYSPASGAVSPVDGVINRVVVDQTFSAIQSAVGNQGGLESNSLERFGALNASTTSNQYAELHRSYFNFDTSAIGTGNTITAVTLNLYGTFKSNGLGSADLHIGGFSPPGTSSLPDTYFDDIGSTSFGSVAYADYNTSGYNQFIFNASGIAAINKTGVTSLHARLSWDILNSFTGTWASGANTRFEGYFADNGSNKPTLTVTYVTASGTTGQIKVWNSTAFVSKPVKVWNGSAWVTKPLKRWNGSAWVITPY